MRFAGNIGESFEWKHPDFEPPALPDPPEIVTQPCALGGGDVLDSQEAHASDLEELEHVAERYGGPGVRGQAGRHLHAAGHRGSSGAGAPAVSRPAALGPLYGGGGGPPHGA